MATTRSVFVRDATGLTRQFSTLDALLIATGMIFPLEAATLEFPYYFGFNPGADLPTALLIAAGPMMVLMLAYWAMGVIMPRAGNDYVWTGRIFGPGIGFTWSAYYTFAVFGGGYVPTAAAVAYALSTSLAVGGTIYNSPFLAGAGVWFSTPVGEFVLAEILTIMIFIATLVGRATAKGLLYFGWLSAVIGIAIMWWLLGTTNPSIFAAKWNAAFSQYTTYDGMVKVAAGAGWSPTAISMSATLSGVPLATLFYLGGNYVNGVAGEVRDVKKALPISLLVSMVIGMVFWIGSAILVTGATGSNWLSAVGYLYDNAGTAYSAALPFPPSMPLMLGLISYPSQVLFFLVAFGFVAGSLPGLLFYFWIPSRYFFAWSFDRILPTKMCEMNERFGSPTYSVLAIFILSSLYLVLFFFTGFPAALALVTLLWFSSFIIPSFAVAIIPWFKPDYFRLAPAFMQKKAAGVPVITLIGLASALSFVYMTYLAVINPLLATVTTLGEALTFAVVVAAIIIYYVSLWYHKRVGVDIRLAFKQVPPE